MNAVYYYFFLMLNMYLNRRIPYFIQITTFTIRVFIVFLYLPHHSHMLPREHVKLFHGLNTILFWKMIVSYFAQLIAPGRRDGVRFYVQALLFPVPKLERKFIGPDEFNFTKIVVPFDQALLVRKVFRLRERRAVLRDEVFPRGHAHVHSQELKLLRP